MQTWEQWVRSNKHKMKHPVDFEERFAMEILPKIPEITPEDVIPQYPFIDFDGGNRYIDFCIKNENKGYFLSIELDGRFKFEHDLLESTLQRQNALVAKVGTLVRYANKTWLSEPNQVIKEISTILASQKDVFMTNKKHQEKIEMQLQMYQQELVKLKQQPTSPHNTDELKNINEVMLSLTQQVEGLKKNSQSQSNADEFKTINQAMLNLTQQMEELKASTRVQHDTSSSINSVSEGRQKKENKSGIQHVHMALIGIFVVAIAGLTAYSLKGSKVESVVENREVEAYADSIVDTVVKVEEVRSPAAYPVVSDVRAIPKTESSSQIHSSEARRYIGQQKIVCGYVAQLKKFSKGVYVNFGGAYPRQDMTAVVWSSDAARVGDLSHFKGTNMCIAGKISSYKGRPQIKLSSLSQLK